MLQLRSCLSLADNTGATRVRILQIYPGDCKVTSIRGVAKVLVKKIRKIRAWAKLLRGRTKKILFKRARRRGWIVRVNYNIAYCDGTYLHFYDNSMILVRVKRGIRSFRGKKFYGFISRKLRFEKMMSLFRFCL